MGVFDKAQDLGKEHSDKVEQGVEKGGDAIDEKTGGKHADQVDQGQEATTDFLTGGGDDSGDADATEDGPEGRS